MTKDNARAIALIILWAIVALFFCYATTRAAPSEPTPCKLTFDRALALIHDDGRIVDAAVGELAIVPTTSGANFYGLPRVVTVTLFKGDTFAGLLDVRGRGDVLRIRVRPGGKALETCWSGAIDAAIVQGWLTSPNGQE